MAASGRKRLVAFNREAGGSSRCVRRLAIMTEPPSLDAGAITDKGYVNQRAVLERRAGLMAGLQAEPVGVGLWWFEEGA
jgi:feruloyl-CoA synthase